MHHLLVSEIEGLLRPDKYPLCSGYDPRWVLSLDMGPHPLWQLEDLMTEIELRPGMRVLDLGSGRGATSVFLAREFGVDVVACDLWVPAEEAQDVFDGAGVADRVQAVHADVRELPFSDEEFDAIISIDAFEYFGTDVHLLPGLLRVLKPGGAIGMSTPALRVDPYEGQMPEDVRRIFAPEAAAWHSPGWWQRHWELSELLEDVHARWQEGGREDWLLWERATREYKGEDPGVIVDMLERDVDELIGFTLISARKRDPGRPS
jgi:cyclopropane fatty-acyl-phospholipid synthase-like methyltransferase